MHNFLVNDAGCKKQLLSCGFEISTFILEQDHGYSFPLNETTCHCKNVVNGNCKAQCGTKKIVSETVTQSGIMYWNVSCPKSQKVLGCHMIPNNTNTLTYKAEKWMEFYPDSGKI